MEMTMNMNMTMMMMMMVFFFFFWLPQAGPLKDQHFFKKITGYCTTADSSPKDTSIKSFVELKRCLKIDGIDNSKIIQCQMAIDLGRASRDTEERLDTFMFERLLLLSLCLCICAYMSEVVTRKPQLLSLSFSSLPCLVSLLLLLLLLF